MSAGTAWTGWLGARCGFAGISVRVFTDDNASVFETDIERLATAGVTFGCNAPDNTRFCPDEPVTRGQMAAFLKRALDR